MVSSSDVAPEGTPAGHRNWYVGGDSVRQNHESKQHLQYTDLRTGPSNGQ
jgi:hypothetical protein